MWFELNRAWYIWIFAVATGICFSILAVRVYDSWNWLCLMEDVGAKIYPEATEVKSRPELLLEAIAYQFIVPEWRLLGL